MNLAAGLIASLAAIKLTFLAPFALVLVAFSARSLVGLAAGTAVQLLVSFAGTGLAWPRQYLAVLRSPGLDPFPTAIPGFRGVASLIPSLTTPVVVIALVAGYCVILGAGKRLSKPDAMAVAMAIGVITAPHALAYDAALCLPLFVRVVSMRNWSGRLAGLCLTPLPYLLLTAPRRASSAG